MCKYNFLLRRKLMYCLPNYDSHFILRQFVCFCSSNFSEAPRKAFLTRNLYQYQHSPFLILNASSQHRIYNETFIRHKHVQQERIREVLKEKKDRIKETGQELIRQKHVKQERIREVLQEKKDRIKESGQELLKDIRDTKNIMKERMEEIVERENVWTIPNLLCVSRIAISPYLGYLITQSNFNLALGIFAFAGITDLIDGWIARTYPSQATKMGSFLDPMADKVLIAILFLTLTYMDLIPVPLTGMIIIRDLLLVAAGFYIRYQSLPAPRTLARYFDVTHATAQLAPTLISKINTTIQLALVATTLAAPVFEYVNHPYLQALWYVTAATTIGSALSYVVSQNTYKFLKQRK